MRTGRTPRLPDLSPDEIFEAIKAAPRPAGSYPRHVGHVERVMLEYNPRTDQLTAKLVEASQPVVTAWDRDAPQADQRAVGSWDVMPHADGVHVVASDDIDLDLDDAIVERMRQDAGVTGETVREPVSVGVIHDLDTHDTASSTRAGPRVSAPADGAADGSLAGTFSNPAPDDVLGTAGPPSLADRYKLLAEAIRADQRKSSKAKKRSSSANKDLKDGGYKLPQIVIKQETIGRKRIGGL